MGRTRIEQTLWMNGIGFGLIAAEVPLARVLGLILFVVTLCGLWILATKGTKPPSGEENPNV